MFDDLRQDAEKKSLFDEEQPKANRPVVKLPPSPQQYFLGMTPPQRFFIAIMLLAMICILGSFCLLVAGKILPPFF